MRTRDQQHAVLLSYSNEFKARLRRINAFTDHRSSIGSSHEGILRRFLQQYVPKKFTVSEGFIVDHKGQTSGQCDIIIWSSLDNAPLYIDGDFVIVHANAVSAVIEVKTSLHKAALLTAFKQLKSIHEINAKIYVAIFAFSSSSLQTTARDIIYGLRKEDGDSVDAICSLSGWALQRLGFEETDEPGLGMVGIPSAYLENNPGIALPFLPVSSGEDDATAIAAFLGFLFIALELKDPNLQMAIDLPLRISSWILPGIGADGVSNIDSQELQMILEKYLSSL